MNRKNPIDLIVFPTWFTWIEFCVASVLRDELDVSEHRPGDEHPGADRRRSGAAFSGGVDVGRDSGHLERRFLLLRVPASGSRLQALPRSGRQEQNFSGAVPSESSTTKERFVFFFSFVVSYAVWKRKTTANQQCSICAIIAPRWNRLNDGIDFLF